MGTYQNVSHVSWNKSCFAKLLLSLCMHVYERMRGREREYVRGHCVVTPEVFLTGSRGQNVQKTLPRLETLREGHVPPWGVHELTHQPVE